jgi:asparagine synthase (glutamine-hydrolysing)
MCGLLGWVTTFARRERPGILRHLTDCLAHRGPDGAGYTLIETRDGGFQVALGHRRLSIIDEEGGRQPMQSADGRFTLIFNGEIYNYVELREQLLERGHDFGTRSDTEVLIEAYRAWGLDALTRFRGMFAFALWDADQQRLIFARDPFGKKPLFLAHASETLLFGSEIQPLLCFPGIDREINGAALAQYLLNRYVPGPLRFFRSVTKLQPGHYAIWQQGQLRIERYFSPPLLTTNPDVKCFQEAVEPLPTGIRRSRPNSHAQ